MKFNTKTIHAGQDQIDPAYNSVMPPIYQTSTYAQTSPGKHKGFEYSRSGNPTRTALEKAVAGIENGKHGLAFGSGLAAIDAVMKLLKSGDQVLTVNDLYGGTYRLFSKIFEKFGLQYDFVDMEDPSSVENKIAQNTKMIWIETPTNPMMNIVDIEAVAKIANKHNLILVVDNTFASPYLQQPLNLGADIVMHSATKYLGGHSDVVMGVLALKNDDLAEKLYFIQNASGAVAGPQDSFLVLRGIKTLHLRMQRHCENGKAVAEFLNNHPKIDTVYWPGLADHPNHEIAKKQMKDFGGMLSFTLKSDLLEDAVSFVENIKVFTLAESLGGVESLAEHPASMTHASVPKENRAKLGIKDSLIRLSVGVEDEEDLVFDLKQALK